MDTRLEIMTKDMCRAYMKEFVQDAALFADPADYKPYIYQEHQCDAYFERHAALGRVHLAVMLDKEPIGEIVLKNFDRNEKHCTLGICMKNDTWKGKGYGTLAEKLTLDYAFQVLDKETVYADALRNNTRSQHVLKKAGFIETGMDEAFRYYRCDRAHWHNMVKK